MESQRQTGRRHIIEKVLALTRTCLKQKGTFEIIYQNNAIPSQTCPFLMKTSISAIEVPSLKEQTITRLALEHPEGSPFPVLLYILEHLNSPVVIIPSVESLFYRMTSVFLFSLSLSLSHSPAQTLPWCENTLAISCSSEVNTVLEYKYISTLSHYTSFQRVPLELEKVILSAPQSIHFF